MFTVYKAYFYFLCELVQIYILINVGSMVVGKITVCMQQQPMQTEDSAI